MITKYEKIPEEKSLSRLRKPLRPLIGPRRRNEDPLVDAIVQPRKGKRFDVRHVILQLRLAQTFCVDAKVRAPRERSVGSCVKGDRLFGLLNRLWVRLPLERHSIARPHQGLQLFLRGQDISERPAEVHVTSTEESGKLGKKTTPLPTEWRE